MKTHLLRFEAKADKHDVEAGKREVESPIAICKPRNRSFCLIWLFSLLSEDLWRILLIQIKHFPLLFKR